MIISTTPDIAHRKTDRCLGLVVGEVVLGANVIKDVMASFRDFFGGRSGAYEGAFSTARQQAISEASRRAQSMGADAIVGFRIDVETIGKMMIVIASGTAIRLVKDPGP